MELPPNIETCIMTEKSDPMRDFRLASESGKLRLIAGASLPSAARNYLEAYVAKTHKYRNISVDETRIRFSLYQPVMNSLAGERSLYMRLRRKYRRERIPQAATIGITGACQCGCVHCSADYHMDAPEPSLGTADLQNAIQESIKLGVTNIILLGGEPLLRKDLESIIESVDSNLAQCVLFTNGEFLSPKRCQTLYNAGLSGLFVSVDSVEAQQHDSLRKRKGLFELLSSGIGNARAAGLDVAISSYLTGARLREGVLESMVELGSRLGVQEVTFFDAIPVGRMTGKATIQAGTEMASGGENPASGQKFASRLTDVHQNNSSFRGQTPNIPGAEDCCSFLTLEDRERIQQLTVEYRKRESGPSVIPQSVLTSEIGSSFCFAANTQFYLSSTGHMCPCDFTPLTIGRYPESSIEQLWEDLTNHPLYARRSRVCRMQDADFREKTILRIPQNATLPYPMDLL